MAFVFSSMLDPLCGPERQQQASPHQPCGQRCEGSKAKDDRAAPARRYQCRLGVWGGAYLWLVSALALDVHAPHGGAGVPNATVYIQQYGLTEAGPEDYLPTSR